MKKGQAMVIDLLAGMLILFIITVGVLRLTPPVTLGENVATDASSLASTIFSPFPVPWNATTVIRPGFVVDHVLNTTYMNEFDLLMESEIRSLTGITSEFYINVSGTQISFTTGTLPSIDAHTVHDIKRYASYNGTIVIVEVITWLE